MRATGKLTRRLAACLALVATSAAAQSMTWERRPSAGELDAVYPPAAKAANVGGHVFLGCQLDLGGDFRACGVAGETPGGQGFGKAALTLVPYMKTSPRQGGARLVPVTIPVHFGPASPERPTREKVFKTSDGRFSTTEGRFKKLAPIGPYWPDMALRTGLSGYATIDCKVREAGALADCEMVGDRTSHPSFGYATLAMAKRGWMSAGPAPPGNPPPSDGVWRFEVDFPRRTLDDAR